MKRISVLISSAVAGFLFSFTPVWYWVEKNWTSINEAVLSGFAGMAVGLLFAISWINGSKILQRAALVALLIWLLVYAFSLSQILPHCVIEDGEVECLNMHF